MIPYSSPKCFYASHDSHIHNKHPKALTGSHQDRCLVFHYYYSQIRKLMVTVALMGGNVIALVLNILNNVMGNAMVAWTNVEKSALLQRRRQPHHTSTCARTSASTTP